MNKRNEGNMLLKEFNVYKELCPSRNVLELISDKSSVLLISILLERAYRFGELKRELEGISAKVLTQTLVKLERYGFIVRIEFAVLPMKVEYSLSALGKELGEVINSLKLWTEKNMRAILQAENQFENERSSIE